MDFKDQIKQLSDRVVKLKEQIATEEATKNAFIMPFLQILGYDVFNPLEVVPEYVTDIGTKKGEKIDYAIDVYKRQAYSKSFAACDGKQRLELLKKLADNADTKPFVSMIKNLTIQGYQNSEYVMVNIQKYNICLLYTSRCV